MQRSDTIAAVATAMAGSGIGVIRISGEEAFAIAEKVFRPAKKDKVLHEQETYTIHYGKIMDGEEVLDEVIVLLMKGPHSYTAEDTVEIDCHGGVYVVKRILELVLRKGARAAEPGEFTKRAFLNGRIDLSQAEAVMDVIQAKNEYALKSSIRQLRGSVRDRIRRIREQVLYEIAFIESALDDPEHISLEGYPEGLAEKTRNMLTEVKNLIVSADNGRLIKEGVQTVILGKPNAGKSSLMNALIGEERAIVTNIAGTTRDTLEETIHFEGITLKLIDTAGIRQSEDMVEQIGVERAKEKAANADLILYVVDSSTQPDENDREIINYLSDKKAVILLNKSDLIQETTEEKIQDFIGKEYPIISISVKENKGIDFLEKKIKEMFYTGNISFNHEIYITNARQKASLIRAEESLKKVQESIAFGMPEDFFTIDLMSACEALGEITGETASEDLINEIFGKFCMGK